MNMVSVLVGDRGTGKTTYLKKLIPIYLAKGMKVLIIDTLAHDAYVDIPIISIAQLPAWKKGVYRLIIPSYEFNEAIAQVKEHVWNALIVVEDAYKVIKRKLPKEVEEYIIDTKQKNVDMIFMYHSWAWVMKDLITIADCFQLFKTGDHPSYRKEAMAGCYPQVERAYNKVMQSKNPYETISILK